MTTAVWRPRPGASYPVLGVESNGYLDGLVDIVFEAPDGSKDRGFVRMRDIEVRPRSIVRSLTATFTDHSRADCCQCGRAQAANPLSQEPAQPAPVATQSYGLTGGGEAGAGPNLP